MKKILLTTLSMASLLTAYAVPAKKVLKTIVQPDGTELTIQLGGDEFFSFHTTLDGIMLQKNDAGFYCYAVSDIDGNLIAGRYKANNPDIRSDEETIFINSINNDGIDSSVAARRANIKSKLAPQKVISSNFPTKGEAKGIILLVEFSDIKFSEVGTNHEFSQMMNQVGYSNYNATGSARDYFTNQSAGQFNPQFDIIGPITLDKPVAAYGAPNAFYNDCDAAGMINDACIKADKEFNVDFTQYDNDNDGEVDIVYVIYAGYGEAQGGSSNTIWPHASTIVGFGYNNTILDGKKIDKYACSCELMGYSGTNIDGIGTFCHEFSHCLGLADLYDTRGGGAYGVGKWGLMDSGVYLNDAKTPPNYSAFERYSVGWLEFIELTESENNIILEPLNKSNKAYRLLNPMNRLGNEYFILENRQHQEWDTYLPGTGGLIHHIDYDDYAWGYNVVNNTVSRPMCYIIPADNQRNSTTETGDSYPGTSGNTTFSDNSAPSSSFYTGQKMKKRITNMREEGENLIFDFHNYILNPPVSSLATDISTNSFTANWTEVADAISYTVLLEKYKGGAILLDENFDGFTSGTVSIPTGSDISSSLDNYTSAPGWSGTNITQAGGIARIGSPSLKGKLVSPALDFNDYDGKCKITFSARARKDYEKCVRVLVSKDKEGNEILFADTINLTSIMTDYEINAINGIENSYLIIDANAVNMMIDNIKIVSGGITDNNPGSDIRLFENVTGTSLTINDLEKDRFYNYSVKANSSIVYSEYSNIIRTKTTRTTDLQTALANKPSINITGKIVTVNSNQSNNLHIYSTNGILVKSIQCDSAATSFELNKGIYIVRMGSWSGKIAIF